MTIVIWLLLAWSGPPRLDVGADWVGLVLFAAAALILMEGSIPGKKR